ncbi:phage major capsid protein, P2 family [Serratia fonticola]|uniref:phage major capsid protein, P2 family n=1 Tax=Serratia fonticola TaxID=47917 RepID=UPI0016481521|nr:phage major capsid protein, P2 family [Serratia fonticola]MBC3250965.1 phage major capsid protein, P2 family [Serratia fonticola]
MQRQTREAFNTLKHDLAALNGVSDVAEKFDVTPRVQQTLETRIQESSGFLKKINMLGVKEQVGDKVGIGVSGTIASTTDTTKGDRQPFNPTDMNSHRYMCEQTNFDTAIRYPILDAWAGFPDFQTRVRNSILRRQGLDRIMIGWNGTHRAPTSNRAANPLLQDVNVGWLEDVRKNAPQQYLFEVKSGSNEIKIGKGITMAEGFKNLDAVVLDATSSFLQPWYQDDTELVVICGRELLTDKYFPIVNQDQSNTEQLAADLIISQKRIGNLPAIRVPYFPANAMLICPLYLLSLYWQLGSRRRTIVDNAKRDQIENYESTNDAYVIEDYDGVAFIENLTFVDNNVPGAGGA